MGHKELIYKYNLIVNGYHIETNILGWRTALAHARNQCQDLFEPNKQVEILCIDTGQVTIIQKGVKLRQ